MHKTIPRTDWLQSGRLSYCTPAFHVYPPQEHDAARQSDQDIELEHLEASSTRFTRFKQLKGFELDDSYGKVEEFAGSSMWSDQRSWRWLTRRPLRLLCDWSPKNGGTWRSAFEVTMNLSSLWMLTHAFHTIKAFWGLHLLASLQRWLGGFQLNADVTDKLCRKNVDLLAFSVT